MLDDILQHINKYNVISFDIFDTLITRKVVSPTDVFNQVGEKLKIKNYKKFRVLAEKQARESAFLEKGTEEVTLSDIITRLCHLLNIDLNKKDLIEKTEIYFELSNVVPRKMGVNLLRYCLSRNKKVIFVSDMYLGRDVIAKLLNKCNIPLVDDVFISCELGKNKKTGSIFPYITGLLNVSGENILHIGDNELGDSSVPIKKGWNVYRIPRSIDIAKSDKNITSYVEYFLNNRNLLSDCYVNLLCNKYYDSPIIKYRSLFSGNAYRLGYLAMSLLVVSFAVYIHRKIKEIGIDKVYFLSRDTKIVYDVFNKLFSDVNTHYILSSRSICRKVSAVSMSDLLNPVYSPVYSQEIGYFLTNNYNIELNDEVLSVLNENGIDSFSFKIGNKFDKNRLTDIVFSLKDVAFDSAKKQRMLLTEYLNINEMCSDETVAIVDIGYAATAQSTYIDVLSKDNIYGIYLGTFNTAYQNLRETDKIFGYLCNFASPSSSNTILSSHRFLCETVFCDSSDSFLHLNDDLSPVFDVNPDDDYRKEVVSQIHEGVLDFVDELIECYGSDIGKYIYPLDIVSSTKVLSDFFCSPQNQDDVKIFEHLLWLDSNVQNARPLVCVDESISVWKEGAKVLARAKSNIKNEVKKVEEKKRETVSGVVSPHKNDSLIRKVEHQLVRVCCKNNKLLYQKYTDKRTAFFMDSRHNLVKKYFLLIGKKV